MVEARQFSLTLNFPFYIFFTARLITSSNAAILHLQKLGRSNVTHHFLSDKMGKPVPKRISCILNVRLLGYFLYSSFISKEMVYFNFIYIGLERNSLFITD